MGHTGGGCTTEGETEMTLEHAQPLGSAGVSDGDVTDALAEGPPRAGWVRTAEASQPEAQADGPALPRQIGEGALAVTVLAACGRSTGGTARRARTGYDAHDERVGRWLDADDGQAIGHEGQDTAGHGVLRQADLRRWGTSRWPAHFATRSAEEPSSVRLDHRQMRRVEQHPGPEVAAGESDLEVHGWRYVSGHTDTLRSEKA